MIRLYALPLRAVLFAGFFTLVVLTAIVGWFGYREANVLGNITERFYRFPYTVSVTVRDIEIEVVRIHRAMKDVAFATQAAEVDAGAALIAAEEKKALDSFPLLTERYLGQKDDIEKARQACSTGDRSAMKC